MCLLPSLVFFGFIVTVTGSAASCPSMVNRLYVAPSFSGSSEYIWCILWCFPFAAGY